MPAERFEKMVPEKYKEYRGGRHPRDLFVSPQGNDKWSGTLPDPSAQRSDGPFASIERARNFLRQNPTPGPVTVWIRGGLYEMDAPLVFGPEDSGPVTYAAWRGEAAILDGGRRITGWRPGRLNGREVWTAEVPEAAGASWHFTQLFVGGQRRPRPRLPKDDCFRMVAVRDTPLTGFMSGVPTDRFIADDGGFHAWQNLADIDVVAVHYWNEERMPVASFDASTSEVRCTRKSVWPLKDDAAPAYARYWVENVKEALTEPGEWYLDRSEGLLYYAPTEGEAIEALDARAPRIPQLLIVAGDVDGQRPVVGLRFEGLQFRNTTWFQPGERAGHEQAAFNVPAVVSFRFARHCALVGCGISNAGMYGVEIGTGCAGVRVEGNSITDMGAGGVKCIGVDGDAPAFERTHGNVISDNVIAFGGKVFASAVGVLVVHSFGNDIVHNHIHHLEYSGISCGWTWGYGPSATRDNLIGWNRIHHIGSGLLNDMGGIYTLGVQPGTVIRNNLIHDVRMHNYGGWAIYADEGSSHLVVEDNVCYDTDSEVFQLHYGRENVVRNNLFAFSRLGLVSLTVVGPVNAFTFVRNVVITDRRPVFVARNRETLARKGFDSDLNLFWDASGQEVFSADQHRNERNQMVVTRRYSVEDLRALGLDGHSVVGDPRCRDVAARVFELGKDSPALALGFRPIDLSNVGPRAPERRPTAGGA